MDQIDVIHIQNGWGVEEIMLNKINKKKDIRWFHLHVEYNDKWLGKKTKLAR